MAYCTLDDIKSKRIPETTLINLTDDEDLGVVAEAVVEGIIGDVDELIDGYLRGRYSLPLDPVPGIVKALSADIAVYNLYGRRAEFDIPKAVGEKFAAAMKILDGIQAGKIALGSAGVQAGTPSGAGAQTSGNARVFTRDSMKGF